MGSFFYGNQEEENEKLIQFKKYNNSFFLTSPYLSINANSSILIDRVFEDFNKFYKQIDILERNQNSKIIHIIDKKTLLNKELKDTKIKNELYYQDSLKEIEALKDLDHPNIIKIYE